MIRVFLLALVALAALVLVSNHLPYQPLPPRAVPEGASGIDEPPGAGPFARWDGVWEGTLDARRSDGTLVERMQIRQVHTMSSATEQRIDVIDRGAPGSPVILRHVHRVTGDHLECRVTDPNGAVRMYGGNVEGGAIFWHSLDPGAHREESYREEILRTAGADLYTVDGVQVDPKGGTLLYEGRYRRSESRRR
ncbi:MAG TPA: hypothetical protein VGK94_02710 [Candidatus Polarisedimenticolia bacterium]|jgi:hypothetical protein